MSKGTYIELYNPESQRFEKVTQPFISSKKLYDALDLQEKFEKGEVVGVKQELDLSLEFIEGLFDSEKVTKDSILEGIAAADLMDAVNRIMSDVVGKKQKNRQERRNNKRLHTVKQNKN